MREHGRVTELELTRSRDDRRLFVLEGVGALRAGGWFSRGAEARAEDGRWWTLTRPRMLSAVTVARDAAGAEVGRYTPRSAVRRGGAVSWEGRELALRPAASWRERYALADGARELATIEGRGWGRRPVRVTLADDALDSGLLLFAVHVVRGLADDAASTAGAVAATSAATAG